MASTDKKKPNILIIWGDDIGWFNVSAYNHGIMGYRTPNIDRIAKEGDDVHRLVRPAELHRGRAAFITGQSPIRTGLTKVGLPGADIGLQPKIRPSPMSSSPSATSPDSLARITLATETSSSRPRTGSMSSSATSIT
jgi:arylsulfatase A-like enzyme